MLNFTEERYGSKIIKKKKKKISSLMPGVHFPIYFFSHMDSSASTYIHMLEQGL